MSYFDERIFQDWDALCFGSNLDMPIGEREERARALLASCLKDGKWNFAINDAGLAINYVVVCALQGERYGEAIEYSRQYFRHPDADAASDSESMAREGGNNIEDTLYETNCSMCSGN